MLALKALCYECMLLVLDRGFNKVISTKLNAEISMVHLTDSKIGISVFGT